MHRLQSLIVERLSRNATLPYSRLKPKNIEGNKFAYHLTTLISDGLISKKDGGYTLTSQGKLYASRLSKENFLPRIQPKIVTLIALTNDAGETLLYRRKKHPFIGKIGHPFGKIHLGESVAEAAARELVDKTGLSAEITHRGEVYLSVFQDEELIDQMLCHVFEGENPVGQVKKNSSIGQCFWKKVLNPNDPQYYPGFSDITTLLKYGSKEHFFAEFTYHI